MADPRSETWTFESLNPLGGHPVTVRGNPKIVATDRGPAASLDGRADQLLVGAHPLRGAGAFTVEILFKPEAGVNIANDPRFLHIMDPADEAQRRLMMEVRVTPEGRWSFDSMLKTDAGEKALLDLSLLHPVGEWATAAAVYDGAILRTFVNGVEELKGEVALKSEIFGAGAVVSVGSRMNQVHFFAGTIRRIRFTRAALAAKDLWKGNEHG